ncbi:MAG: hypothetical protein Q9174_006620, partial [Haloplaca sp. 1 TL-2023]
MSNRYPRRDERMRPDPRRLSTLPGLTNPRAQHGLDHGPGNRNEEEESSFVVTQEMRDAIRALAEIPSKIIPLSAAPTLIHDVLSHAVSSLYNTNHSLITATPTGHPLHTLVRSRNVHARTADLELFRDQRNDRIAGRRGRWTRLLIGLYEDIRAGMDPLIAPGLAG